MAKKPRELPHEVLGFEDPNAVNPADMAKRIEASVFQKAIENKKRTDFIAALDQDELDLIKSMRVGPGRFHELIQLGAVGKMTPKEVQAALSTARKQNSPTVTTEELKTGKKPNIIEGAAKRRAKREPTPKAQPAPVKSTKDKLKEKLGTDYDAYPGQSTGPIKIRPSSKSAVSKPAMTRGELGQTLTGLNDFVDDAYRSPQTTATPADLVDDQLFDAPERHSGRLAAEVVEDGAVDVAERVTPLSAEADEAAETFAKGISKGATPAVEAGGTSKWMKGLKGLKGVGAALGWGLLAFEVLSLVNQSQTRAKEGRAARVVGALTAGEQAQEDTRGQLRLAERVTGSAARGAEQGQIAEHLERARQIDQDVISGLLGPEETILETIAKVSRPSPIEQALRMF